MLKPPAYGILLWQPEYTATGPRVPGSRLDVKSTARNTTCTVLVLREFLSSGRRLSVTNAIRTEIELPGENSKEGI